MNASRPSVMFQFRTRTLLHSALKIPAAIVRPSVSSKFRTPTLRHSADLCHERVKPIGDVSIPHSDSPPFRLEDACRHREGLGLVSIPHSDSPPFRRLSRIIALQAAKNYSLREVLFFPSL